METQTFWYKYFQHSCQNRLHLRRHAEESSLATLTTDIQSSSVQFQFSLLVDRDVFLFSQFIERNYFSHCYFVVNQHT